VGDGKSRSIWERDAARLGISDRVTFTGVLPNAEAKAVLGRLDLFVLPSRFDGWGVVVNEACAAGLPVIAARSAGAALDLVEDGRSGFLVDRDDASGLRAKMEFFLADPARIAAFGARSRALAARFSIERGVEMLAGYVEEQLAERGRAMRSGGSV